MQPVLRNKGEVGVCLLLLALAATLTPSASSSGTTSTTSAPSSEPLDWPTTSTTPRPTNKPALSSERPEKSGSNHTAKARRHKDRTNLGYKNTVPPYVSTLWTHKNPVGSKDGKMVGIGIKVGPNHTIVHHGSWDHVRPHVHESHKEIVPGFNPPYHTVLQAYPPSKVHIQNVFPNHDNISGEHSDYLNHEIEAHQTKDGPFGLLHHTDLRTKGNLSTSYQNPEHSAPLEHDKNQFGSDCHLHAWSTSPEDGSRSGGTHLATPDERHFASFPVTTDPKSCKDGHCTLTSNYGLGRICRHADRGAPITCGPDKKVTYLANPDINNSPTCKNQIKAYHVPHMIDRVKAATG